MSEQKHTSGPWEVAPGNDVTGYPYFYINGMSRSVELGELVANARLIAAAPEMLEALKEIVHNWDGEPEDMAAANAAIAKATGR